MLAIVVLCLGLAFAGAAVDLDAVSALQRRAAPAAAAPAIRKVSFTCHHGTYLGEGGETQAVTMKPSEAAAYCASSRYSKRPCAGWTFDAGNDTRAAEADVAVLANTSFDKARTVYFKSTGHENSTKKHVSSAGWAACVAQGLRQPPPPAAASAGLSPDAQLPPCSGPWRNESCSGTAYEVVATIPDIVERDVETWPDHCNKTYHALYEDKTCDPDYDELAAFYDGCVVDTCREHRRGRMLWEDCFEHNEFLYHKNKRQAQSLCQEEPYPLFCQDYYPRASAHEIGVCRRKACGPTSEHCWNGYNSCAPTFCWLRIDPEHRDGPPVAVLSVDGCPNDYLLSRRKGGFCGELQMRREEERRG